MEGWALIVSRDHVTFNGAKRRHRLTQSIIPGLMIMDGAKHVIKDHLLSLLVVTRSISEGFEVAVVSPGGTEDVGLGCQPNATYLVAERREPSGIAVSNLTHRTACAVPLNFQVQQLAKVGGLGCQPQVAGVLTPFPATQVVFRYDGGWTGDLAYAESISLDRDQ